MCDRYYDEHPEDRRLRQQIKKLEKRIESGKYHGEQLDELRRQHSELANQRSRLRIQFLTPSVSQISA